MNEEMILIRFLSMVSILEVTNRGLKNHAVQENIWWIKREN